MCYNVIMYTGMYKCRGNIDCPKKVHFARHEPLKRSRYLINYKFNNNTLARIICISIETALLF